MDQAATTELYDAEELKRRRAEKRALGSRGSTERAAVVVGGVVAVAILGLGLADGGFEPAVWAQATILVWWTALVALVAGAWPRSAIPGTAALAALSLLGLAALSGLSLLWASDLGAAFEDTVRAAGYLGVFALAAIAARAGLARPLLTGIAAGLVAIGVVALLSRLEPGLISSVDEARGLEVSGGRLSWPLGYWNGLGGLMAIAIPLLLWLAASAGWRGLRTLAICAIPICVLTMFFTGSRGSGLAAAAAVGVLVAAGPRRVTLVGIAAPTMLIGLLLGTWGSRSAALLNGAEGQAAATKGDELLVITIVTTILLALAAWFSDRWLARLRLPVIGVGRATAAGAVLLVLAVLVADPVTRLRSLDEGPAAEEVTAQNPRFASVGGSGRTQFWETAADAFASEPLHGIGAGGYEPYWALNGSLDFSVTHAHSFYLESAAELGLAGGLLAVAFFAVAAIAGVRRLRSPTAWAEPEAARGVVGAALAVLAGSALIAALEWTWDIPVVFVPAVVAAACLCVPSASRATAPDRRRPIGAIALVSAAGLASIAAAVILFGEQLALERSRDAVRAGELTGAVEEAEAASDWMPFAAEPYTQLALIQRRRGDYTKARSAIEAAEERAPEDWSHAFVEAGIELQAGNTGAGIYSLSRAEALNPRAPDQLFQAPSSRSAGP